MVGATATALDPLPNHRSEVRAGLLATPMSAAVHLVVLALLYQWHGQPPALVDEPEFMVDLVPAVVKDAAPASSLPTPAPPKPAIPAAATAPARSSHIRPPAPLTTMPASIQSDDGAPAPEPANAPGGGVNRAAAANVAPPESGPTIGVQVLDQPRPAYPLQARRHHQEGEVLVAIQIGSDGMAQSAVVERSSGYVALDEAAIGAILRWRFAPAMERGKAVTAIVKVPIHFRLTE